MSDSSGWATPEAPQEDDPMRRNLPPAATPVGAPTGWGPAGYGSPTPAGYGPPPPPAWGPALPPGYGPPPAWAPRMQRKPGIVPLRPLLFSEILDGGFQAMRTNPRTMIGISAVVIMITTLLSIPIQAGLQAWWGTSLATLPENDPAAALEAVLGSSLAVLPGTLIVQLAGIVLNALLVVAVSSAVLGRRTSPGDLWRQVRGRVPAAVGLALLSGLVTVVAVTVTGAALGVPAVLLMTNDQVAAGVLLLVLALAATFVVVVLLWVRLSVAAPALLLEGLGVRRALARSWRLVRGSFWRTLLILFVANLLITIGSALLVAPFSVGASVLDLTSGNGLHTHFWWNLADAALAGVGQTIGGAILHPWSSAVIALVYIDLRMRREGLDLELIRAVDARGTA